MSEPHAPTVDAGELAVRKYLEFVEDPSTARDTQAIADAQAELAKSTDVIERLRLTTKVERLELADGEALRRDFVKHARLWAAGNRVSVSAFKQLGVNDIVLAEAGFDLGRRPVKAGKGAKTSRPDGQARAASVSSASIRQWMMTRQGSFSMAEAMTGAGGSLMTVKKVVSELVASNQIRSLGHIASPGTRGRAPERFERV